MHHTTLSVSCVIRLHLYLVLLIFPESYHSQFHPFVSLVDVSSISSKMTVLNLFSFYFKGSHRLDERLDLQYFYKF